MRFDGCLLCRAFRGVCRLMVMFEVGRLGTIQYVSDSASAR